MFILLTVENAGNKHSRKGFELSSLRGTNVEKDFLKAHLKMGFAADQGFRPHVTILVMIIQGAGAEMNFLRFLKAHLKMGFAADGRKILPQVKVSGRRNTLCISRPE